MNSARRQIGILILLLFIPGFLIGLSIHPSPAAEGLPGEDVFSVRARNEPLRKVLKKISAASGYEIRFNTQLADERISIQLEDVNLNEALARVLQPYNHMSIWDDANHIITLIVFKKNSPPVAHSGINKIFELATDTTASP